jgi:hypothetical protein
MVLIKVQETTRHFKAYYQDNSLLIQLMIIELFEIHQQVSFLKNWESFDNEISQENIDQLKKCIIAITGEPEDRNCLPIIRWSKYPLPLLKDYCEHFFYNTIEKKSSNQLKFSNLILQVCSNTTHMLNLIRSCKNGQVLKEPIFLKIRSILKSTLDNLTLSKMQLLKILKTFKENENVIFFLLRKKDLLIKLYGSEEINKFFTSFINKNNLIQLLIKRFKSRGFHHLLPTIKQELFFYESFKHFNR